MKATLPVILAVVFGIGAAVGASYLWKRLDPRARTDPSPQPGAAKPPPAGEPQLLTMSKPPGTYALPLSFESGPAGADVRFDVRQSELIVRANGWVYELRGHLTTPTKSLAAGVAELSLADGSKAMVRELLLPLSHTSLPLEPGDVLPFGKRLAGTAREALPETAILRLKDAATIAPLPGQVKAAPKAIKADGMERRGDGVALAFVERSSGFVADGKDGGGNYRLRMAIENRGSKAIRSLELAMVVVGSGDGRSLQSAVHSPISDVISPPLMPGQRIPVTLSAPLTAEQAPRASGYELRVGTLDVEN